MARLKVFVSSTCYDLSIVRSQVRSYVKQLGHDPVMSDYMEVLYDPREHTHKSCIQEVSGCDVVVLIIGSRFGGKGVPAAFDGIDFDALNEKSKSTSVLQMKEKLSVTQLEICKAIEDNIPVFTFVDDRVLHDHLVYETNKNSEAIDHIKFPSIEKPESAKYIFEFINFLRHRTEGNSVNGFSKVEDINQYLSTQWSSLFQRLLHEQRNKEAERKRIDYFANQIADLKAAVMSSIQTPDLRLTASGAIRFRRLIDFVRSIEIQDYHHIILSNCTWDDLLRSADIVDVKEIPGKGGSIVNRSGAALIRSDGTFYETRFPYRLYQDLALEWGSFVELNQESRSAIIEAVSESSFRGPMAARKVNKSFDDLYNKDEFEAKESLLEDDDVEFV
ncbi:Uncharacterised protein [Vibrio mimicus]|uniref:DUF4062 domain-containing protein n=1 Tax=Vibrio mimicus TaxID=674 RepID=UPI000349E199|nr:DUF4062 domain-containing protein [Vibrio mimicus]MBY7676627.1 DUF4062 domain-containing protein [Vibrio mimicus]MBY7728473.1 DUF4062 domain-containing protein [Vibrio mimicus]TXY28499.1 DUF4062 domain-containing protein [Vibrio mimicus]SUQ23380.1 Uncharacterised protein [Vibrio mimicus]